MGAEKLNWFIPENAQMQSAWFAAAGVPMPEDIWLKKLALLGLCYFRHNQLWDGSRTLEESIKIRKS